MKPGVRTTEFWLTIIAGLLTNLGAIPVPENLKWVVTLGLVAGYAISRGLAKYEGQAPQFPVFGNELPIEPVDPVAAELAAQEAQVAAAKPKRKRRKAAAGISSSKAS